MSKNIGVNLIVNYDKLEDKDLVKLAHGGDGESLTYLIKKYQNFVRLKSRHYFLIGADKEDLLQEGMIGLYKAIRDFKEEKMTTFRGFAELCINRQMLTAIKTASRQKHGPLNTYVSMDKPLSSEDSTYTLMDLLTGEEITNPEEIIIDREKVDDIELKIAELLSDLEREVLNLYMDGHSYVEISEELNTHVKSIDNALQRVKRKLERSLEKKVVFC